MKPATWKTRLLATWNDYFDIFNF